MAMKDINTATREDLQQVPQMSEARAETIIHYRDNHGKFSDMKELAKIPGIAETMAQQIAEYFSIGDENDDDQGDEGRDKQSQQERRTGSGRRSSSTSSEGGSTRRSNQG